MADLPFPCHEMGSGWEQCLTLLQVTHWVAASWPLSPHAPGDIVKIKLLEGSYPLTSECVWEQPSLLPLGCQLESEARPRGGLYGGGASASLPPSPPPLTSPRPLAIADLSLGKEPG